MIFRTLRIRYVIGDRYFDYTVTCLWSSKLKVKAWKSSRFTNSFLLTTLKFVPITFSEWMTDSIYDIDNIESKLLKKISDSIGHVMWSHFAIFKIFGL